MTLKMGLNLSRKYPFNFKSSKRLRKYLLFIIIHYTGMKKERDAINKLCDPKSNVSAHYFIKKNGEVLNLVPDMYEAWHAGKSKWKKYKSLNKYSIGIEISNAGHQYGYKKFSSKQILSLIKLLKLLVKKYNIKKQNILGHSDIAPNRKKDPGEKFPWSKLANKNLCKWHNLSERKIIKKRNHKLDKNEEKKFFKNLNNIGYSKLYKKTKLVTAFQRRFRQNLINGKIDQECLLISDNILKT